MKDKKFIGTGSTKLNQIGLEKYQRDAINIIEELDKENYFSTLINLPTGAGKTRIALYKCVKALEEGHKVLWLADRIALLEQTIDKFGEIETESKYRYRFICGDSAEKKTDSIADWKKKVDEDEKRDIEETSLIFSTIDTFSNITKEEYEKIRYWFEVSQNAGKKLYIVYDEAHRIGAPNTSKLFASLFLEKNDKNSDEFDDGFQDVVFYSNFLKNFGFIGMTATVYRGDKAIFVFNAWFKDGGYIDENEEIKLTHISSRYGDYFLNDEKDIGKNLIVTADIDSLINCGRFAAPKLVRVDDFKAGLPKKIDDIEIVIPYLVDRIERNYKSWGQTVVIVPTIKVAKKLAEELNKVSIAAYAYVSNLDGESSSVKKKKERIDELNKFRHNESNKIFIAVHMLDEGIDIPTLNTIYLFAPTYSHILLRQRIGRVTRAVAKKTPQVIWQYYLKKTDDINIVSTAKELVNLDMKFVPENEQMMEQDIEEYEESSGVPLPAPMYRKPLPKGIDFIENYFYSTKEQLEIKSLFGDDLSEAKSVGYYYLSTDNERVKSEYEGRCIYVRDIEREGYQLYLSRLKDDKRYLFKFENCDSFEKYAKLQGFKVTELIEDIKEVCFYLPNVHKNDLLGKKSRKRFFVTDDDIKTFFAWFVKGEICYYSENNILASNAEKREYNKLLDKLYQMEKGKDDKSQRLKFEYKTDSVKELKEKILEYTGKSSDGNRHKEYTDLLMYGTQNYLYPEMMSARTLMRIGAVFKEWEAGVFPEKFSDGNLWHMPKYTLKREYKKEQWLFLASALIEVVNHIKVTQNDIDQYEKAVQKVFKNVSETKVEQMLRSLGYAKRNSTSMNAEHSSRNDLIIQHQCKMFSEDIPRIVQYLIYEKAYYYLAEEVSYINDGKIQYVCCNREELVESYNNLLKYYGVLKLDDDLNVIEDVIYDYHPYIRAVPYYQGIKPEFLCRLVNDLVQYNKDTKMIVDGFGGSGACTVNGFYRGDNKKNPQRVYNDLGIMNTSFYRCIQKDPEKVSKRVEEILNYAFGEYDENDKIDYFEKFIPYVKYYEAKKKNDIKEKNSIVDIFEVSIADYEKGYVDLFEKWVIKAREKISKEAQNDNQDKSNSEKYTEKEVEYGIRAWKNQKQTFKAIWLEDRMYALHDLYISTIGANKLKNYHENCRSVERYMHTFMTKVKRLYHILVDEVDINILMQYMNSGKYTYTQDEIEEELAVLFFIYNSLPSRHFYHTCTIRNIGNFLRNYKKWLVQAQRYIEKVDIVQEDALGLLVGKSHKDGTCLSEEAEFDKKDTVFYLDIPYVGTDVRDYVPEWFDPAEFIHNLSKIKGKYIVSSRCNICLPDDYKKIYYGDEDYTDDFIKKFYPNGVSVFEKHKKEFGLFSFFSSFVDEETAKDYKSILQNEKKKDLDETHICPENSAKYVLIPITQVYEVYEDKDGKTSIKKEKMKLTKSQIQRMISRNHLSGVPLEVMITNIDIPIDDTKNEIRKIDNGVWVKPTFKTGVDASQYYAEPIIAIIEYKQFIKWLIQLLYPKAWVDYLPERERVVVTDYYKKKFEEVVQKR